MSEIASIGWKASIDEVLHAFRILRCGCASGLAARRKRSNRTSARSLARYCPSPVADRYSRYVFQASTKHQIPNEPRPRRNYLWRIRSERSMAVDGPETQPVSELLIEHFSRDQDLSLIASTLSIGYAVAWVWSSALPDKIGNDSRPNDERNHESQRR